MSKNNVTSISDFSAKKNAPDPQCTFIDDDNITWFEYTYSYKDERQRKMSFTLWATSVNDAKERLASLKANAQLDGQLISKDI